MTHTVNTAPRIHTAKTTMKEIVMENTLTINTWTRVLLSPKVRAAAASWKVCSGTTSLSSDPSDCVRPPPPKPHKHKKGKRFRQASLSSSDDEIVTTPECTSCDEPEIESESVSEKGMLFFAHRESKHDKIISRIDGESPVDWYDLTTD